jgi:hypothetical protein
MGCCVTGAGTKTQGRCNKVKFVQPELTRVSSAVRSETLSIYYGTHSIVMLMLSHDASDQGRILNWLDAIGPQNAARVNSVYIVYSRKRELHEMEKNLLIEMKRRGVRTSPADHGVVTMIKLGHPYLCDNESILHEVDLVRFWKLSALFQSSMGKTLRVQWASIFRRDACYQDRA